MYAIMFRDEFTYVLLLGHFQSQVVLFCPKRTLNLHFVVAQLYIFPVDFLPLFLKYISCFAHYCACDVFEKKNKVNANPLGCAKVQDFSKINSEVI